MAKTDLATRATRIAEATPRAAIQTLLKALMPDRTVNTRAPVQFKVMAAPTERQPGGFGKLGGKRRRAVPRIQRYAATGKPDTSRYGTFRNYMLTTIILAHDEVSAARAAHIRSGQHADQTINFAWAEKEGYIRFI